MKTKLRRFSLPGLIVCLLFSLLPASAEEAVPDKDSLMQQLGSLSFQYALIDNGEITASGHAGVYSKSENRALTQQTMYGAGSVSKMYTTACVMKLQELGKLELDKPVVQYIPEFAMQDQRYRDITVRMLLNHSSGLMGSSMRNAFLFEDSDSFAHDRFLETLRSQRLKAAPGEFSVYCNDGFVLAEILVERVSGMDFTAFLHQYITQPLELERTKTPKDSFSRAELAKTYLPNAAEALPTDTVNLIGTGGIYTTAEELCEFARIFSGETDILSEESVGLMANKEYANGIWPQQQDSGLGYGLGWDSVDAYPFNRYGIQALAKGGDTLRYHASLVVLPEYKLAAAVMSSGGSSLLNEMYANALLLERLKEKEIIEEILPDQEPFVQEPAQMPQNLIAYSGIYAALGQVMEVAVTEDGLLKLNNLYTPEKVVEFKYALDGSFVSPYGNEKIRFVNEEGGRVYIESVSFATVNGLGQSASTVYALQKLETQNQPFSEAWLERRDKLYYILTEKYSSQNYLSAPFTGLILSDKLPGYVINDRIESDNVARSVLEIPGSAGRDLSDYEFYEENGTEYIKVQNSIGIREEGVPVIYGGAESVCTIQQDGYARWYKVQGEAAGKTMAVKLPEQASFAVYDAAGACVGFSLIGGVNPIRLPENGSLVFIGSPGAQFEIQMSE